MPDGADHGGLAGGHGPDERLVGERQQVLDRPATAGNDDDLYRRVRVEALQAVDDLGDGVPALDRNLLHPEPHRGPAPGGIAEDVPFRGRVPAADQADLSGQERQPSFTLRREETLRRQRAPQPFQPGEQLTDANGADFDRGEGKRSLVGVEVRLGPDKDPGPFGGRGVGRVEHGARADDPDRYRGDRIAEGQERGTAAPG